MKLQTNKSTWKSLHVQTLYDTSIIPSVFQVLGSPTIKLLAPQYSKDFGHPSGIRQLPSQSPPLPHVDTFLS